MIPEPKVTGLAARGLKTLLNHSPSRSIVLLAQDLSHWYVSELTTAANQAATANGYTLIALDFHRSPTRERDLLRAIYESQVQGCIFLWDHSPENLDLYQHIAEKCACIQIGDRKPILGLECITGDDYSGALTAVNHLISVGYRQIGHLTLDTPMEAVCERRRAFLDALQHANLQINEQWIVTLPYGLTDADRTRRVPEIRNFFTQSHLPRALFICADWLASEAIECIQELGLRVPDDIALVGFDDAPPYALTSIPLTTIHVDLRQQGRLSVERLLFRLQHGNEMVAPGPILIPPTLVVRSSSVQVISTSHRWDFVMNYILEHFREELSVQHVAALLGLDSNYFSHQFRQLFGKRFTDHVNQLRLHYASELLATTQQTIDQIARDSGFNSVNHFYGLFKRAFGVSPHAYRKQQTFQ